MSGLWPNKFDDVKGMSPRQLIEQEISQLENITGGVVYASLRKAKRGLEDENTLSYKMLIQSKYLANYRFHVFTIDYDIPYYPLFMHIEDGINDELDFDKVMGIRIENEDNLRESLGKIFNSNRLGCIIGTLINVSKEA